MSNLTREDVLAVLGPINDFLIVDIITSGATMRDLAEARTWLSGDPDDESRPIPEGRLGAIITLLLEAEAEGAPPNSGVKSL